MERFADKCVELFVVNVAVFYLYVAVAVAVVDCSLWCDSGS